MASVQQAVIAEDSATPRRQIAQLGFPLLLAAFSSSMSGVVDTAMMGHFSSQGLAATSGASAIFDIFSNVVLATIVAHQILAARFAGRDDPAGIRASLRSSLIFSGGTAVVLTVLCELSGGWLTGLVTNNNGNLRQIGASYLLTRGPTLLLIVPFGLLAATFNAYKKPRYALVGGIIVSLVNLLLDWLLIYGPGPLPRLGASGNGLATTISWLLGIGYLLFAARQFKLAELLRRPGPDTPVDFTTSVPRLSWPSIVSAGLDYASMAIFFVILSRVGQNALGGGRIAFEMMILIFGVGSAFAAAGRILIGRSAGAKDLGTARVFWRSSQFFLLVPALLLAVLLVLFPTFTAGLFSSFGPLTSEAAKVIPLVAVCVPLMAWTLGNVSLLRAFGQTRWDMYGNLFAAIFIQLPVGYVLADVAKLGVAGAYVGVVCYWAARTVMTSVLAQKAYRDETQKASAAS